jgi:CRISPR/Cas system Type II protein with McrA/HNH and RuvC-like nuclease domain
LPGALTSQLRYNWGVEAKNRDNNLHHAEDAIILAFSTQGEVFEDVKGVIRIRKSINPLSRNLF